MRYRQVGDSGLTVSVIGLGGNTFGRTCDLQQTRAIVDTALELGVTHVDTAEMYGGRDGSDWGRSEEFLGEALLSRRHQVVLATKFGSPIGYSAPDAPGSRSNIRRAVEGSLARLQTDYLDLYYLHFADPRTPVLETLEAMNELVDEGKVRYIATCRLPAWQLVEAEWSARLRGLRHFIATQDRYNLLERQLETDVVPACRAYGLGVIPFTPLASGLLTGKYRRGQPPPAGSRLAGQPDARSDHALARVEALEAFAAARDLRLLDVAVGGLAAQPMVASVITGVTSPDQLKRNVAAAEWLPDAADLHALDQLTRQG